VNLVFAGTPPFAARILDAILGAGHRVSAVYTAPDRPAGRGLGPSPSAVKQLAVARGLELRQPHSLRGREQVRALATLAPQVMVVAAYGLLLPRAALDVPRHGCINVHASLLPRWRGAAPIQRAILAGDTRTGVSIMRMDEGLDTGPVLAERSCPIGACDTAGTLHDRLAALGAQALLDVLPRLARGEVRERAQDPARATYAARIDKAQARLDWQRPAAELDRRVRAFNPKPMAWTLLPPERTGRGRQPRLRVLRARALDADAGAGAVPGEVVRARGGELLVACAGGALALLEIQPAGRRAMSAADFLNARGLVAGDRLR